MRLIFDFDYPVGSVINGLAGVPVPAPLAALEPDRLRWDGSAVVDVAGFSQFYVDGQGRTHIAQHDPAWPLLACDWDAELINDGGWRLLTDADRLSAAKNGQMDTLKNQCSAAIRAGWVSSALGSDHRYDTDKPTDQLNLIAAGLGGVDLPFTCTELATETKQQRPHTAAQLAQVYAEASAEKARLLGLLDDLRQQLGSITITTDLDAALADVAAVVWVG